MNKLCSLFMQWPSRIPWLILTATVWLVVTSRMWPTQVAMTTAPWFPVAPIHQTKSPAGLHPTHVSYKCIYCYLRCVVCVCNVVWWSLCGECQLHFMECVWFPVDTCYGGEVVLSSGSASYYPNGYREYSGRVEVCVNGEYIDVCPGSVDIQHVCSYLGYSGIV